MSKTFQVTAASETVILDKQRKGEASFVVTNTTSRTVHGLVSVKIEGGQDLPWIKVEGPARDFAPNGQEQFSVSIVAPVGFAPGEVRFHIEAVTETDPDADWTASPTVRFEVVSQVHEEKPWIKRFWWIFLIAGLVIIGIVLAIVLTRPKPQTKVPDGGTCSQPEECVNGQCNAGICQPPVVPPPAGLFESCDEGVVCANDLVCVTVSGVKRCLGSDGFHGCSQDAQCQGGYCNAQSDCGRRVDLHQACQVDADCSGNLKCAQTTSGKLCKRPPLDNCADTNECRPGLTCVTGRCLVAAGQACASNQECRPGAQCVAAGDGNLRCLLTVRQPCADPSECMAGLECTAGSGGTKCLATLRQPCQNNEECGAGLICDAAQDGARKCVYSVLQSCNATDDCRQGLECRASSGGSVCLALAGQTCVSGQQCTSHLCVSNFCKCQTDDDCANRSCLSATGFCFHWVRPPTFELPMEPLIPREVGPRLPGGFGSSSIPRSIQP